MARKGDVWRGRGTFGEEVGRLARKGDVWRGRGTFGEGRWLLAKKGRYIDQGRFSVQNTLIAQGRTLRFKHERFIDGSANQPPTFREQMLRQTIFFVEE